jgi:hypothetical protein
MSKCVEAAMGSVSRQAKAKQCEEDCVVRGHVTYTLRADVEGKTRVG